MSYVYHSLYAYFDRDNVGLPGMAKFFKVIAWVVSHHGMDSMFIPSSQHHGRSG
mgnify:CR=1 FL=1